MQNLVFVPGIFGTTMLRAGDGFTLWPPLGEDEPLDVQSRATELVDPSTVAGAIVENIPLLPLFDVPEYGPVTTALAALPGVNLTRFPYDWRVDIRKAAATLADTLSRLPDGPIVLVAHSMGGLVCRYLLESQLPEGSDWIGRVRQLICIATPHLGAPVALLRVCGLEGLPAPIVGDALFPGYAMGILASKPALFPAGHQLLPPPVHPCVRLADGRQADIGTAFPAVSAIGLNALANLHSVTGRFRRPPQILYRLAYGIGQVDRWGQPSTTTAITLDTAGGAVRVSGDGDGTVPVWSGLPATPGGFADDHFGVIGDHVGMLGDPLLLDQLTQWITPNPA